ncbi:MAG: hypothetical protein K0R39_526 [Symbiobacteriaceae bacterium]|jgi:hypothetical protein|nr:hypothetical protein [Symbiobacteriaceae bacterium]
MKKALTCLLLTASLSLPALPATAAGEPGTAPVRSAVTIRTAMAEHGVMQSEIYAFTAAAGDLIITLSPLVQAQPVLLMLEDAATGEVLLNQEFSPAFPRGTVRLPRSGAYRLLVAPNQVAAVTLNALDLVASAEVPAIAMPPITPFEVRNERFSVTPQLPNPDVVESVAIGLNGETLSEGAVKTVEIDPAALGDGLYTLTGAVMGTAGNMGLTASKFVVDRVDSFSDVAPTHWARPYVEVMHHVGVVNGRGAGTFAPDQSVTRAEFAKMLALTLGREPSGASAAPAFADVPADFWGKAYIEALAESGLIRGEEVDGKVYFRPDRTITRAEAATILGRVLGAYDTGDSGVMPFADAKEVPAWAAPAVAMMAEMGWIKGFPDGKYYPGSTLKRDQAARVLANFLGMQ